ncbi:MAG: hypothetical protein ACK58L_08060 [Planctomycetota bacterium]
MLRRFSSNHAGLVEDNVGVQLRVFGLALPSGLSPVEFVMIGRVGKWHHQSAGGGVVNSVTVPVRAYF